MRKLFTKHKRLYLIIDTTISNLTHRQIAQQALSAGIRTIQLREKHLSKKEIYKEAAALRSLTKKHKTTLIINDYVDIALMVNADGVHFGQDDMPIKEARKILGKNKIIGVSTHTLKQAAKAQEEGADYIGFGPIFQTATKDAGSPKGVNVLREIRKNIKVPIVAIGGITFENVSDVMSAGADAAAMASGILCGDIKSNIRRFLAIIKKLD